MNAEVTPLVQSGRLRRADAALAAWIGRAYPDARPETVLAAALAARAIADGHSALELGEAQAWFDALGDASDAPTLPTADAWRAALAGPGTACVDGSSAEPAPLTLDAQGRVYLSRYFGYERTVAATLAQHARTHHAPPRARPEDDGLDPGQRRAVTIARTRGLALVTGGPGSGKTYCVARTLAALLRDGEAQGAMPRIALAAPTGKAAARLGESLHAQVDGLGLPDALAAQLAAKPQTLHRLLGISPWRAEPRHHHGAPLPFDVVVVDEASMVDLPLMARLADALPDDARLILLGDPHQLSAVEAGNVLPALVDAAAAAPFADCHAPLSASHRFGDDTPLGRFAGAIVHGHADAAIAIPGAGDAAVRMDPNADFPRLLDEAASGYAPLFSAPDVSAAVAAANGFRILTALRHGPDGCIAINRDLETRLKREHGIAGEARWWRGRLVLVTANRPELGLFNGDNGVTWPDAHGDLKVWFDGADGPRAFAPAALPPHEGAFALTVHKAQGSEFERVALVTGPESAVLTRELLYTGVTRARSALTVYAAVDVLRAGIARQTLRMTGLADRLREAAANAP